MSPPNVVNGDRVLILANPKAGWRPAHELLDELVDLLHRRGLRADVASSPDALRDRAAELHEAGNLRAVVGIGGDGTAAELVNRTPPGVAVTVLPKGTENLLARHFQLGRSPEALVEAISAGHVVQLDAGLANDRVFLIMASCGFDAEVVRRMHGRRKGNIHRLSYAKPIATAIRSLLVPGNPPILWERRAASAAVGSVGLCVQPALLRHGTEVHAQS